MATIVSTRILRLQAISPRSTAVVTPSSVTASNIVPLSGAPSSPTGGQVYYDSVGGASYFWDAVTSAWVSMGGGGAEILEVQVFS